MTTNTKRGYGALALLVIGFAVSLTAQTKTGAATLDDLLGELRAMRADMAQSSTVVVRAQLLVARIQVQEQRVNTVARQITETQNELSGVRQMVAAMAGPFKQAETDLDRTKVPEERRQLELMLIDMKSSVLPQIEEAEKRMQALTLRESELANQFAGEQARWIDFNDRLDALERSLIGNR